jgi:hypothetical protein
VPPVTGQPSKGLNVALWAAQALLCAFFAAAGYAHGLRPFEDVVRAAPWAVDVPRALLTFISVAELAGAIGVVVPWLTGIKPMLTPLAAAGLGLLMVLAMSFHLVRGEAHIIGIHVSVLAIAAFVVWGRTRRSAGERSIKAAT